MNRTVTRSLVLLEAVALLTAALAAAPPSSAQETQPAVTYQAVPTISTDEMRRGQKGYGLSVFHGTEPERFEVEVLGVLQNSTPELSYILARLSGQDLERSGVAGGMSGSPVYLDGRLAGAVSFSYVYGLDAIAGITPIGAMRRLTEIPRGAVGRPIPGARPAAAGLAVEWEDLVRRRFSPDLLAERLGRLRPAPEDGSRAALQWTASGFGSEALGLLSGALGPLTPAAAASGGGIAAVAAELAPGSAVAAVLVDGDLSLAAHGTVTERVGDEVLAFGHPVFSLGPVNLPMAPSEVVTVIANVSSSFKVSNAGPVIGAFDQDREAGVRGRLGLEAPTTPITVRLRGLAERQYRMRVANLRQLRPTLLAVSALGALTAGSYSTGTQGLDLTVRFRLAGHEDLEIRQSFEGDQAGIDSVVHLLGVASFLELNPFAEVELEGVEVELDQVERPQSATLVAAYPQRSRVEPGQTVPVTLELQEYRGERRRKVVEVVVPETVPAGRYSVLIGDGTSMDAARLTIEQRTPQTLEQALALLRSFRSRRELVTYGLIAKPGLALAGEAMPDLPGSVRSIVAAGATAAPSALWLDIAYEAVEVLQRPVDGVLRVDLEVRRPKI